MKATASNSMILSVVLLSEGNNKQLFPKKGRGSLPLSGGAEGK